MFGMAMWLVRGNMFLGVGRDTQLLLVRVGEERVEGLLAAHPVGVARCGAASGRVFPGTLMVETDQCVLPPTAATAARSSRRCSPTCSPTSAPHPSPRLPRPRPHPTPSRCRSRRSATRHLV